MQKNNVKIKNVFGAFARMTKIMVGQDCHGGGRKPPTVPGAKKLGSCLRRNDNAQINLGAKQIPRVQLPYRQVSIFAHPTQLSEIS